MSVVLAVATRPCMFCRETSIVEVDPERYARWQAGELIQDVWPEWTRAQRELLITGTHPVCWNSAFPADDAFVNDDGIVPTCDICGVHQSIEGDDWNGETGNHHSCEEHEDSPSIEYPHGEGPYTFDSIDIYGNDPYELEG